MVVKDIFEQMYVKRKGQSYYTNRHSCYLLQYHMVLVTKYRHPVLTGGVKDVVYQTIRDIFREKGLGGTCQHRKDEKFQICQKKLW